MLESLKSTLPRIYGEYLHNFYIHDQDVVDKVIFAQAATPAESRQLILNDKRYGWTQPSNL